MKNKLGTIIGLIGFIFILGSCGTSPKDEFIKYIETQQSKSEGTYNFNLAVEEVNLANTADTLNNPMINMMTTQLKDISLEGSLAVKNSGLIFSMDMGIKAFGMDIPLNIIGDFEKEGKAYLATDTLEYVLSIANSMTGNNFSNEIDFSNLNGTYIDIFTMSETFDEADLKNTIKEIKEIQKNQKEVNKKIIEYMSSLDKNSFTKKDGILSNTLTKDEITQLMKITNQDADQEINTDEILNDFKTFSVNVEIDTKTNKVNMILDIIPGEQYVEDSSIDSVKISFEIILIDKKANINMPEEDSILSEEEIATIFPEETASEEIYLSPSEYEDFKAALIESKADIDEDMASELLVAYQTILTEEQYREIEDILKK